MRRFRVNIVPHRSEVRNFELQIMLAGYIQRSSKLIDNRYTTIDPSSPKPMSMSVYDFMISLFAALGVDFYCRFLPAKLTSRFLLPISSRQIERIVTRRQTDSPPHLSSHSQPSTTSTHHHSTTPTHTQLTQQKQQAKHLL